MIANQTKIEYIQPSTIEQCIEKEVIKTNGDYNKFQEEYLKNNNVKKIDNEIQLNILSSYLSKTNGSIIKEDADKLAKNILEKFKYNEALIELVTKYKEISAKISSIYNNSWNCIWLFLILHVIVVIILIIQIVFKLDIEMLIRGSIVIFVIFVTLLPIIILIFFSNKEIYIENKLDNIKYSINLYNNFKFSFINHILIPFIYLCFVSIIVLYIIGVIVGVIEKKTFDIYLHDNEIFGQKINDLIFKITLTYLITSLISIIYIFIKRYQYKQYRTTKNIDYIIINQDGVYINEIKKYEIK